MNKSNELTEQLFLLSASRQLPLQAEAEDAKSPSRIELAAYHLGVLPQKHIPAAEAYLNRHPSYQAEFCLLDNYLSDLEEELPAAAAPEASASWWEQVGEGIRILIANLLPAVPEVATFALLGEESKQKMYEVDGIQLMIQIEEDDDIPNRKLLLGLLIGIEPQGITAHLWQSSPLTENYTIPVDEFGNFIIPALEPGQYELILSNHQTEIHIPKIIV